MREFKITKGTVEEIKGKLKSKLDHYYTVYLEDYKAFHIVAGVNKEKNYILHFTAYNAKDKDYTCSYIIEGKDIGEMIEEMFETIKYIRPHRNEAKKQYLDAIQALKEEIEIRLQEEENKEHYIAVLMTLETERLWILYGVCENKAEALEKVQSLKSENIKYYDEYKILREEEISNFDELGWRTNIKFAS
jgi:hypothetical protein